MVASDYPITTPYGYVPGYPLNGGFHRGQDRVMPTGTPVLVNGVQIGLSGNTGYSTGAHLHVGRFVTGAATDPQGGGFSVASASVTGVGYDAENGHYVQVRDGGDGSTWVYLHLNSTSVVAGQRLTKPQEDKDMAAIGYDTANQIHQDLTGQNWDKGAWQQATGGALSFSDTYTMVANSQARKDYQAYISSLQNNQGTVLKPGTYKVN